MDLTDTFEESEGQETEQLLLTDASFVTESEGHRVDTPVVHCRCRTADGDLRTLEVEGFRPYFYIPVDELVENPLGVLNDRRVIGVEGSFHAEDWDEIIENLPEDPDYSIGTDIAATLSRQGNASVFHIEEPTTSLEDDSLVRVIVKTPGSISGGRGSSAITDHFDTTYEADIPFVRRFLIDTGIYRGVEAPVTDDRLRYENWHGESGSALQVQDINPCKAPEVDARICTFDLEVATNDDGFPEPHRAKNEITAIGAHDSYRDEYRLWGLVNDEWAGEDYTDDVVDDTADRFDLDVDPDHVEFFEHETQMLESFHAWFLECDPDVATGWNSDGFDVPYIIQRSYNVNALAIRDWATVGKPGVWAEEYNGETQTGYSVQGRSTLDMFDCYTKTQYRDLDSYKLEDVATAELGFGKVDLAGDELDEAWTEHPIEFFVYNLRDVQAVVEIEREVELMDLYENLREVTGALYETCNNNGPMLDVLFLRKAFEQGLGLPTNEEPDENVYHGAKVFPPVAGVHRNCVYPDLSSMYPNLFAMLNLGSETIIGTKADLEVSPYTEGQCYKFPVDNRDFAIVPKGETIDVDESQYKGVKSEKGGVREMFDAQYDWLYVLKPAHRESFIRSTIDELIDLKYQYEGGMYEAVKRVVNSCYGVMGDSESGGKGFRLYDRRVAEGITLAGRLTITHTAETFTQYLQDHYDEDAFIVGGDTDSAVTSMPNAPTLEHAFDWAQEAVDYVEVSYDQFVADEFNFADDDEHRLAVDLESLASTLFFMAGDTDRSYVEGDDGMLHLEETTSAVRKRYAQHIVWDDDDFWLSEDLKGEERVTYEHYEEGGPLAGMNPGDNIGIKGFEYVRSDSAPITRTVQKQILTDILLAEDPRSRIEKFLRETVDGVRNEDVPLSELGRPKGISQQLDEYGWKYADELDEEIDGAGIYRTTPSPAYRGAKYVDEHFHWEDLGQGSKPRKFPIERVRSDDYPASYQYESYPEDPDWPDPPEVGREVDAIAVDDPDRIPGGFVVDLDKIVEKSIEDKTRPILATIDLDWDDLLADGQQATLGAWG